MKPIRLLIADDQSLIRLALRTLIAGETDIELLAEAENGEQALSMITATRPDVVLLDIRMPVVDGIEVLRRCCQNPALSGTRMIMMTTFDIDQYIFEALENGAAGFITKDTDPAQILHAVRVVAAGESLLSPAVTRKVINRFASAPSVSGTAHPGLSTLTAREREIVGWVATGLSNDGIAERLVVSPATVRTHVGRAMTKLSARDRAQLVVIAYRSGLPIPE